MDHLCPRRPITFSSPQLLLQFQMATLTVIVLASLNRNFMVTAASSDLTDDADPSASQVTASVPSDASYHGNIVHLPLGPGEGLYSMDDDEIDVKQFPHHQPESRRAASTGLRLIGLGKRTSGSGSSSSSPLRYIGLGRKRTSAIKYIGLGKRDGSTGADGQRWNGGGREYQADGASQLHEERRRRRDVAMRLIGLGRRASDYGQHQGLRLDGPFDEDSLDDEQDRLQMAAVNPEQWHSFVRRSGNNGDGLRRMQLRRWSSTSSLNGGHVDPALLMMGIGK